MRIVFYGTSHGVPEPHRRCSSYILETGGCYYLIDMGAPYFPLDGINEKGLAVGVLQLQAEATNQNTEKVDVDTTLAIRILLDKAANV